MVFFELWVQSRRVMPWSSSPVLGTASESAPQGSVDVGTNFSKFSACGMNKLVGTWPLVKVALVLGLMILRGAAAGFVGLVQGCDSRLLKSPVASDCGVGTWTIEGLGIWKLRVP